MIRRHTKSKIKEALQLLLKLHHKGLINQLDDIVYKTLQDCQEAAITIGEEIEQKFEFPEKSVSLLERYCEALYQLFIRVPFLKEDIVELDEYISEVIEYVNAEPIRVLVVFFPYKASMWDSLESIWIAAKSDSRCECKVIPIPYYKIDREKQEALFSYEGMEFPQYVPIVSFDEFSLENERPDIAYIHNPYDNCNLVTSVHPDYYSKTLKQYVDKLIYVPYYVNSGTVSEHHKDLPAYENVDYMIVQSEYFRKGFISTKYYNKVLAFGSPKFDRIFMMTQSKTEFPEEWKNFIGIKATVMLNTSINCFLYNGEAFIKKLKYIFELFEKNREIVLIWRPHPLLEATIKAMRWELSDAYQEIKQYFVTHQIGILDVTPDITKTVVSANAYIGESSSSVVSLFDVAGKPIYILDNNIYRDFTIEEEKRIRIIDAIYDKDRWWLISLDYNGLFYMDDRWEQIHFINRIEGQNKWTCTNSMLELDGDNIWLSPYNSLEAVYYSKSKQKFVKTLVKDSENISAMKMFRYKSSVFYFSMYQNLMLEWNLETKEYIRYEGIYSGLYINQHRNRAKYMWDAVCDGKVILITSADSNKLLKFDMESKRSIIYKIGSKGEGFTGIVCDSELIYVSEGRTGNILCFNKQMRHIRTIKMPSKFGLIEEKIGLVAHSKLIDMKDWIVTIPHSGNSMLKINKKTRKISILLSEFWKEASIISNGYVPDMKGMAIFAKPKDTRVLLVQRLSDGALAEIDIKEETYEVFYPQMSDDSFQWFIDKQDGFEKLDKDGNFVCRESQIFPMKRFVDFLTHEDYSEIKERQMKSIKSICENLDGSCGQRVHDFVIGQYLEKEII